MKQQIRIGVFETNSSSEHSLAVMNLDKFRKWKNGELVGRVVSKQEAEHCWGNFWSRMLSLEFTDDLEKAKLENEKMFQDFVGFCKEENENYKQRCLSYKPKLTKTLTDEELKLLSNEEYDKYNHDKYMDDIHKFDENAYNQRKLMLDNMKFEDIHKKMCVEDGVWCTYQEFWDSWTKYDDCQSPFEHDDTTNNVHIIGKYYHS